MKRVRIIFFDAVCCVCDAFTHRFLIKTRLPGTLVPGGALPLVFVCRVKATVLFG